MSDPEILREVERWLRFSREDLLGAETLLEEDNIAPRLACFHAQQAAEKAVKASLIFLQIRFAKTHELELLCNLLPDGWQLKENPSEFSDLSDWAVEPRYPSDIPEATKEDAETAIEQAREVYEKTLEDLKHHGYAPEDE